MCCAARYWRALHPLHGAPGADMSMSVTYLGRLLFILTYSIVTFATFASIHAACGLFAESLTISRPCRRPN
jgi:mannose/fructose/N-acetylgalactosamine-specific phosphotransferase system component IID